ncbi:MAG: chromosome partitioning protein [Elusimicrobia bacterium GWC2_51_8]|nr:MAG: chromosome partitioning protein [Elusimicrobia bacterium GWA2_51_34]OGR60369.1 MAG: chromosome partitioning protein [Elusimicrobia bacterium GWC2_51_8]HAF95132.1 chromosome partitioning protein [Elusimicrobiota bacterium]HCE97197.1 chromosome partitioning protein [Elusimicrobiota bacterium]
MAEIVSIANQKGGVGKTTTAINLAVALASFDYETLLIDFDPQSNSTSGLGVDITKKHSNIYDVLSGKAEIESAIKQTSVEWLDIVPTSHNLAGAEIELVNEYSREAVLKKALDKVRGMYKFIIIDCPPSLGLLTVNALNASDSVITPVQCEYYAMQGLAYFMNTVEKIRQALNPKLKVDGGIITMYDSRINLANQVKGEICKYYGDKLYKTIIPRNVRLAEAPSFGQSIFVYDPSSRGALAYKDLAIEFLSRRGVNTETYKASSLYVTEEIGTDYDFGG